MYDGAPDGAVLLGLDRRSFYAVACVRQADVLGIKEAAEGLQVHLQRAAATAMASSTAAEALRIMDTYRREEIGTEQAPTKPPGQGSQPTSRSRSPSQRRGAGANGIGGAKA